jgi:hypothetical protein
MAFGPGFDGVVRWKSLILETLFWLSGLYAGWGGAQKWLQEQDVSFYCQGLENLIKHYDRCLNKFGNYVET